jgi:hypothetical protein
MILASMLPHAIALIGTHQGNAATRVERWARIAAPPFTILVVGIALLDVQKMDAYSFAQLVVALVVKTATLRPGCTSIVQRLYRVISESISKRTTPILHALQARLPRFPPSLLDKTRHIRRYLMRVATSPHLMTTALIFFVDGLGQLPKRWSFLTRSCWIWGFGVLVVRGLGIGLDRMRRKDEIVGEEGYSRVGADPSGEAVRDDRGRVTDVGLQSCISGAIAILTFAFLPTWIASDTTSNVLSSAVYVKSISSITIAWMVLWFVAYRTDASGKPVQEQGPAILGAETNGEVGKSRAGRWMARVSLLLATVPVILAVMKHGVSWNTLLALSGGLDKLVCDCKYLALWNPP